jgi:hypothetical protein
MLNDFAGPLALLAQSEASEAGRSVGPVIGLIVAALLIWLIRKIFKARQPGCSDASQGQLT